jgi:ribosomal protein L37E
MDAAKSATPPPVDADDNPVCDVCGGPTFELRCKIICRTCGYTRDCSDP